MHSDTTELQKHVAKIARILTTSVWKGYTLKPLKCFMKKVEETYNPWAILEKDVLCEVLLVERGTAEIRFYVPPEIQPLDFLALIEKQIDERKARKKK